MTRSGSSATTTLSIRGEADCYQRSRRQKRRRNERASERPGEGGETRSSRSNAVVECGLEGVWPARTLGHRRIERLATRNATATGPAERGTDEFAETPRSYEKNASILPKPTTKDAHFPRLAPRADDRRDFCIDTSSTS